MEKNRQRQAILDQVVNAKLEWRRHFKPVWRFGIRFRKLAAALAAANRDLEALKSSQLSDLKMDLTAKAMTMLKKDLLDMVTQIDASLKNMYGMRTYIQEREDLLELWDEPHKVCDSCEAVVTTGQWRHLLKKPVTRIDHCRCCGRDEEYEVTAKTCPKCGHHSFSDF